ncbi:hypothetical protein KEJ45_01425 [Candidatus Bathyarchaeota archaeon]|nr:hypothetical protein [Candidatus Bathyarchaeota archaeon]
MDAAEAAAFVFLIALTIMAVILWLRQWRHLIRARMKSKVGIMTFKDALAFIIMCSALLTGSIGALWIYFEGWQDLPRILLICVSFGLLMGVTAASIFYLINRATRA